MSRKNGKKGGDEDFVTVDQVHELLEQQKLFHRELMEQQESNFKNFLTIVNEANNKRLDTMMKEISELRESLHYTQKDVDVLLAKERKSNTKLSEIDSDLSVVATNITSFLPKIDYLDSHDEITLWLMGFLSLKMRTGLNQKRRCGRSLMRSSR